MSVPLSARWSDSLGFWFYLDRAGPGGVGGWIAPRNKLESDRITVRFKGAQVQSKLERDDKLLAGRALFRFSVALPFPSFSRATFGVAGKTISVLVLTRARGAPLVLPAPPPAPSTIEPRASPQGRTLLVLAPIDWAFRRQRSQQLTLALGKHYAAAFYLGPASLRLHGAPYQTSEGVVLPLIGAAPDCDFAQRRLSDAEAQACADGLNALLGGSEADVIVQFPSWRPVARRIWRAREIYDCIDDHAHLPQVRTSLEGDERSLAERSALCLATSAPLEQRLRALGARNVLLAPNAAPTPAPAAWPHDRDAAIVYLGAVEDWFDFDLLNAAAKAVPSAEIRVIGACKVLPPLGLPRRVRFLGELDHARAMEALRRARVGIIPFRKSPLIEAVNPVKAYEYLAAGLPVVMTAMGGDELARAPGIHVAETAEGFAAAVSSLYANTSRDARLAFASWAERETWDVRAAQILSQLNG